MRTIRILFSFLAAAFSVLFLGGSVAAKNPPLRPKISGISHVAVFVSDYCHALTFYSTLQKKFPGCAPEDAGNRFGIGFFSSSGFIHLNVGTAEQTNALAEIGFWTSDVSALREYLRSQGVSVGNNKGQTLRIVDPEGHHISFMGSSSGSKQAANPGSVGGEEPRIIHAGFVVRNRAATDHFYKDILGFRPYWHGGMKDDKDDWVAMQVPDGTDWVEYMLNIPLDADKKLLGVMNHIALGVTDIQATKSQLLKNGATLTEEPKLGRDGKWQLNLYDPDDTRVEFMEFTPKEKPCCSEFTGPHPGPKQ